MTFLTGLSVLTREILKNNVHFCCAVQSTEWDVLLCTSHQPFPTSHVQLQYSLLNRYSTFGWLNCVGRDTWGKNSACYQWAGPWLCNVQNWLRVSLLCLILSFLASKTVSIIVCWHFLCLTKLCGERHLREKLCMVSVEWIVQQPPMADHCRLFHSPLAQP